jgi:hypothetical protein
MANPIERDAEMPFTAGQKDETNEGTSSSIEDRDTALTMIVLLLACLALALLADVVV